jgi:ABC-type transport system substrate-binding protein
MAEYSVAAVDAAIDKALADPSASARARQWAALDKRIMADAPWAPWLYQSEPFLWSKRLRNWTYSPWHHNADLTGLWISK